MEYKLYAQGKAQPYIEQDEESTLLNQRGISYSDSSGCLPRVKLKSTSWYTTDNQLRKTLKAGEKQQ